MMKIAMLLTFAFVQLAMASNGQQLSIKVKNASATQVLYQLSKQSGYDFIYDGKLLENIAPITVEAKDVSLVTALDLCFKDYPFEFKFNEDKTVIIKPRLVKLVPKSLSQEPIVGAVRDSLGNPLGGVSVLVKGTRQGTSTDVDGRFQVQAEKGNVLVFRYVGFLEREITVGEQRTIDVVLRAQTSALDEIVVIGYGQREKKDLTGAVSQITSEEITKQVNMSPQFAMQGRMAGVFVSNPGSSPFARPDIRIRGVSTLGFNDPLYVVDGIPLTEGGASSTDGRDQTLRGNINVFNMINPNDIESISVLKDASATAIYGVRASNGVVLITTKRGSEGKPRVDLSMNYGVQNLYKRYDVASIQQYVDWSLEAINANPAYVKDQFYPFLDASSPHYLGNSPNYSKDWMDAVLQENAAIQDYNISVSGGTKASTYAVGGGYASQQDAMYKNLFERYSFSVNSDHKLTDWLKVGQTYRLVYSDVDSHTGTSFGAASFVLPWQPLYDASQANGLARTGRTIDGRFFPYGYGAATINNFLGVDAHDVSTRDMLRNLGSAYAEISPLEGLRIRGTFSADYYTNAQESYTEPQTGLYSISSGIVQSGIGNTFGRRESVNINIVKEFLVAYNNSFGKHSVEGLFNIMDQRIKWNINDNNIVRNSPIPNYDQRYINEGWPSTDKVSFYERYSSGLLGYMGRLSYNYDGKYYMDATLRRDGTSKFGPGYKWGTFPSFAGAWRISSENFMRNISWLDDLKIRGGWGKTGNQETRDFAYLSLVNLNPKAAFGTDVSGDGTLYSAAALGDFPIADMSWETVTTYSFGFDMMALRNRLSFTAEYYNRKTDGILQAISIPAVIGALTTPVINLAKVDNRGMEFDIGFQDKIGNVGYNISANLTTVRNRVSNMYNGLPSTSGNVRIEDGYSINYLYAYKTDGIFQTQQEVDTWLANHNDVGFSAQKSPGDVRFVDIYGAPTAQDPDGALKNYSPDGRIDPYDMTYVGKTIPGYYYGISIGTDYKNWDLSLMFRGLGDVQKINTLGLQSISGGGTNFLSAYANRWTPSNPSNTIPRAVQSDPSGNNRISDRHVQNAGFFRFQNFQFGYRFKGDFLSKVGVSSMRCYLSGTNLFVISPYDDLDPENITTPTVFSFGANISF
ncbi:TonB-dependent receptor [Olivibacter sitiensis]|uniref:TonB-dependent receptor n=1 Tax=Olivibacter sitiensis TaxID=376470 RepID=UPI00040E1C8D|nr:TonB-dependent receptor [Olivibacter sitiensis]